MIDLSSYRNFLSNSFRLDSIPSLGLIDHQINSYNEFLSSGLSSVFKGYFPIFDQSSGVKIEYISHRIESCKFTCDECKEKNLTYSSDLIVRFRLYIYSKEDKEQKKIITFKEQDVHICSIPLITSLGTFIVNGVERVVVSQIHRSPGVFFAQDFVDGSSYYTANIIPYRGTWIDFVFDVNDNICVKIDKKKKISLSGFLYALGIERSEIISRMYPSMTISSSSNKNLVKFSGSVNSFLGKRLKMDILREDGSVIFSTGSVVLNKKISEIKGIDIYFDVSQISQYCYSYKNIGDEILAGDKIEKDSLVDLIFENSSLEIVDFLSLNFSTTILNEILSNNVKDNSFFVEQLFRLLRPSDVFILDEARNHMKQMFFDVSRCDMSKIGRYKLNAVLGLEIDVNNSALTIEDIFAIIQKLIQMKEGSMKTDDIDHLGNRRVRCVGELVENQIRVGLSRLVKSCIERLSGMITDTISPSDIILGTHVNRAVKDFFMISQLSQFMEQTNPLSEIGHKRRISALGAGGIERDRAGLDVRDVHSTHYGRICIVETPEGQNIGLISNLATFARINKFGFLETPYYKVNNCNISDEVVYLDSTQEISYTILCYNSEYAKNKKILDDFVVARKDGEIVTVNKSEVTLMDFSSHQIVSIIAGLVPFLERDDAYRVLMGSNMQRQAVPLMRCEPPLVGTGIEGIVGSESSGVVKAKRSGKVIYVDSKEIIVSFTEGGICEFDSYKLKKFSRTNQSSCMNYKPIVYKDSNVKAGDVIADGYSTFGREISIGRNVNIALMSWNGFGFEDSIVVSNNLVNQESFTSIHIEEFEVIARDTRLGPEEITNDISGCSEIALSRLDESGIVYLGSNVKAGDILVGKVTPRNESPITPEEKLLRAIFDEKVSEVKDSSLRLPPGYAGTVVDVKILTRRGIEKSQRAKQIELSEIYERKLVNDRCLDSVRKTFSSLIIKLLIDKECTQSCVSKFKLSSSVLNESEISNFSIFDLFKIQLEDKDLNQKIHNIRVNFDRVINELEVKYLSDIEKIKDGDDLQNGVLTIVKVSVAMKSRLQPGDKMAGRHGNKGIVSKVVSVEDMPFMEDGTPIDIIINPLGISARMNLGQVFEVHLGLASKKLGEKVRDAILSHSSTEKIKEVLLDVTVDDFVKDKIKDLSKDEIMSLANYYSNGIPFATPVFDGCNEDKLDSILRKAGCDESGQVWLYDGLTGNKFERKVTVGVMYMLKLHHLVDNKMHARSVGPYSLITQQPLGGKSHFGGQRLGEMECWALQAYGAAYTLQEMLTVKSDDVDGRRNMYNSIVKGSVNFSYNSPESFNVMAKELCALGLDVSLNS